MAVVVGLATWMVLLLASRYVSVASIGAAIAVPIAAWFLYGANDRITPSLLTVLGALAVWRHRSNIERLARGTEHRFDIRRGQKAEARGQKTEPGNSTQ